MEADIDYLSKQSALLEQLGAQLALIASAIASFSAAVAGAGLVVAVWFGIAWVVSAGLVAWAARERGRSALLWLVLAVLLTPVLAGFLLLLFPPDGPGRRR